MTAGDSGEKLLPECSANGSSQEHPDELNKIFEHLSVIKKITFKSQQIDDPELNKHEKIRIAEEIYRKSPHTFLMRFGGFLEQEHLLDLEKLCLDDCKDEANQKQRNEIGIMLENFKEQLKRKKLVVKNRRYKAMQDLLKEGDYFSEMEMMKRAPELYEELVGQYLTEDEKKLRDDYDVKNTTFSGILMHTTDRQEMNIVMEEAAKKVKKERQEIENINLYKEETQQKIPQKLDSGLSDEETDDEHPNMNNKAKDTDDEDEDEDVPVNCRQQWGNFDNEQISCSTSRPTKPKKENSQLVAYKEKPKETFISAGERDLLRQEFMGLMQEKFLAGQDEDFDYEAVDENATLDDLKQINQDLEDAYFDDSDDDDANSCPAVRKVQENTDESEDELDIYMRHLNQHHSLQNG